MTQPEEEKAFRRSSHQANFGDYASRVNAAVRGTDIGFDAARVVRLPRREVKRPSGPVAQRRKGEQSALRLRNRLAVTTAGEPSNAPQERRSIPSLRRGKPEVSLREAQDAKPQCEVFELERKRLRRRRFVQGLEQCQGLKHPEDARLVRACAAGREPFDSSTGAASDALDTERVGCSRFLTRVISSWG